MGKLTKAQVRCLSIAAEKNGVFGLGPARQTVEAMICRGLLTRERDPLGYHLITPEGRAALKEAVG